MDKTIEELKEGLSDDIHNKEFVARYNYAMLALQGDNMAMATFNLAVMDTMEQFAKHNNKTLPELLDALKKIHQETQR